MRCYNPVGNSPLTSVIGSYYHKRLERALTVSPQLCVTD
jgi:hypothetical protein